MADNEQPCRAELIHSWLCEPGTRSSLQMFVYFAASWTRQMEKKDPSQPSWSGCAFMGQSFISQSKLVLCQAGRWIWNYCTTISWWISLYLWMFQDLCPREARKLDESASSCFICLGRFNSNAFSSRLKGNLAQMGQVWWIDLISSKVVGDDVQRAIA